MVLDTGMYLSGGGRTTKEYNYIHICNIFVSAISDLNPEIVARGEAEGCYRGVKG